MAFIIEDGTGQGYKAGVNSENRLRTNSVVEELQHHYSKTEGQVYQIQGSETAVGATTQTILHIKNTSTTRLFVISYIRVQLIGEAGGTALPVPATSFEIGFNQTYTSGGTAVTPVNMNAASGNAADLICYDNSPVVGGTFEGFDTWYPDGSTMMTYSKHGSIALGFNDTVSCRLTTDHTSGLAYCRMTGVFIPDES